MTLSTTRIATYAALPAPRRDPPAPAVNACGMMFFGFMGFTIVAFVMLVSALFLKENVFRGYASTGHSTVSQYMVPTLRTHAVHVHSDTHVCFSDTSTWPEMLKSFCCENYGTGEGCAHQHSDFKLKTAHHKYACDSVKTSSWDPMHSEYCCENYRIGCDQIHKRAQAHVDGHHPAHHYHLRAYRAHTAYQSSTIVHPYHTYHTVETFRPSDGHYYHNHYGYDPLYFGAHQTPHDEHVVFDEGATIPARYPAVLPDTGYHSFGEPDLVFGHGHQALPGDSWEAAPAEVENVPSDTEAFETGEPQVIDADAEGEMAEVEPEAAAETAGEMAEAAAETAGEAGEVEPEAAAETAGEMAEVEPEAAAQTEAEPEAAAETAGGAEVEPEAAAETAEEPEAAAQTEATTSDEANSIQVASADSESTEANGAQK
ncbi:unnamed protein product [Effrenium voratum]|uniref:Uncharacterized protein n=1 Tax=Effrenium voratum TaxID=2562239 RepID=A0AA36J1P9_9DINO|nr:unnamed protein product [Effrenium voratum]